MGKDLRELIDQINGLIDYVVKTACEKTSSGQYYVQLDDALKVSGMEFETFSANRDLILGEISDRAEVLDLEFDETTNEFDVNCGLDYCPRYEWCEGMK